MIIDIFIVLCTIQRIKVHELQLTNKKVQQGDQSLVCVLSILSNQWASYRVWAHLQEDFNLADRLYVNRGMSDPSEGSQPVSHEWSAIGMNQYMIG